jgi:hypothetical protein
LAFNALDLHNQLPPLNLAPQWGMCEFSYPHPVIFSLKINSCNRKLFHRYILGYRIYIYIWVCQILFLGSFWTNSHFKQIQLFSLVYMIQVQVSQIVGCAHHEPTFSVWNTFSYLNWVVVIVKPTVAKQLLHHSWDWRFVTAKTTCFSIMCSENWYHQHIPGWVPFTPSYLQANQNQPSMIMEIKT